MKALYLSGLIAFLTTSSFSQQINNGTDAYPRWQITAGIGGLIMTDMPSGINQQICLGVKFDAGYNLLLSGNHYLTVGIGYENNSYIVDGYFTKSNEQYNFSITPPNYKQHEMSLHYLNVPILYKYRWLNTGSVSIGPYAGYLIGSESKYKIGSDKFEVDAPIENKFRWGLQGEWEFFNFSNTKHKTGSVFGMGIQYQLSNNLNDNRSFKPLFAYFKFGIAIK